MTGGGDFTSNKAIGAIPNNCVGKMHQSPMIQLRRHGTVDFVLCWACRKNCQVGQLWRWNKVWFYVHVLPTGQCIATRHMFSSNYTLPCSTQSLVEFGNLSRVCRILARQQDVIAGQYRV